MGLKLNIGKVQASLVVNPDYINDVVDKKDQMVEDLKQYIARLEQMILVIKKKIFMSTTQADIDRYKKQLEQVELEISITRNQIATGFIADITTNSTHDKFALKVSMP